MTSRKSFARSSPPVASTVKARARPCTTPVGRFEFAPRIAFAASSRPIPRAASACGSSSTRTAYFWAPYTATCATPGIVEIRCATRSWP